MLNGKEIVARGIVTNVPEENVSQHGVDLNLIKVERIISIGMIPVKGKTALPEYEEVLPIDGIWHLNPDVYNITFDQGCKIPNDVMCLIRQRSSLLRCGGQLHSSVFDAGFETENIGTFMVILHPVRIEVRARVAQIYNHATDPVENLYNGQFMRDQQRRA
jgi:deoxycytidine triphosphate deaminase